MSSVEFSHAEDLDEFVVEMDPDTWVSFTITDYDGNQFEVAIDDDDEPMYWSEDGYFPELVDSESLVYPVRVEWF